LNANERQGEVNNDAPMVPPFEPGRDAEADDVGVAVK
jgi:hypothetical protein